MLSKQAKIVFRQPRLLQLCQTSPNSFSALIEGFHFISGREGALNGASLARPEAPLASQAAMLRQNAIG